MGQTKIVALIDTGAYSNAMSDQIFQNIESVNPELVSAKRNISNESVRVASGATVKIIYAVKIKISVAKVEYTEDFIVVQKLTNTILGVPFFKNNNIIIDLPNRRLKMPEMTLQLNEISTSKGQKKKVFSKNQFTIVTSSKITLKPNSQEIILCQIDHEMNESELCGIIEPLESFEKRTEVCVTTSLSKATEKGEFPVGILNLSPNICTIPARTSVGKIKFLTAQQVEFLTPINPQILHVIRKTAHDKSESDAMICELYNLSPDSRYRNPAKSLNTIQQSTQSEFWFPTPESCKDPTKLTEVPRAIYNELIKFRELEKLNPKNSIEERRTFLANFSWTSTILTLPERERIEELLVEYHHIFARHRLDIGHNTEFKVKLTPENDKAIYTQGPPAPIHLRKEILIELALMQYYGIIRTLPFSKHCSPIFAQRKPSGKLRLLIDLRKINHLLRHDYDSHNFPISSLANAGNHLAGKKYFSKLDCSQAFHVVQMADIESVQLLAFNFESRTYAFLRLAQGLSRSVSSFSSFMRQYLDPCIAADRCFQYVDDVGTASLTADEQVENLQAIFKCIDKSGLRLTMKKCEFGLPKIQFLGNSITSQGLSPNKEKVQTFLDNLKLPKNTRHVKRFIGFLQFFRAFIPSLSIKLFPFYKLLRNDVEFKITKEHITNFEVIKEDLLKATNTYLRLAKPNLQYVILTDASYHGAGFVLMVEDYCTVQKGESKILAPVSFGSKLFNPAQLKFSTYAKEFLAVYFAFDTFAHILWGATDKQVVVLTDNKSLARFFQAKTVPTALWTFLDRLLSFNFIIGHIPGRANAAADYLSRLERNPSEQIRLTICESMPMHRIEIDITANSPSQLCTVEEPAEVPHQANQENFSSNPNNGLAWITLACILNVFGDRVTSSVKYVRPKRELNVLNLQNPLDTFDFGTDQLDFQREQEKDIDIVTAKKWIQDTSKPSDAEYLNFEQTKYLKQFDRLLVKGSILYRKFFDNTGNVQVNQMVVPKQLRKELLFRIHNTKFKAHLGITKTAIEFRKKFYFPGFSEYVVDYIRNCETCLQVKPVKSAYQKPPLQEVVSKQNYPGDMLQIDLVGRFESSGGYNHIMTAIDVFSRYLFAIPLKRVDAVSVARALVGIFMRHSYIPRVILTDMGTVFVSKLLHELTSILEVTLNHASVKHSQTIGAVERSHAELKKVLKIYESDRVSNWHKYVDYAIFVHNTTYHSSIGCTPSLLFHGREPLTPLELRFRANIIDKVETSYDFNRELKDAVTKMHASAKDNAVQAYLKYRTYYDKKAFAQPLKLHSYCLLLDPRLTGHDMFTKKNQSKWIPLFKVEKVLTNMNYIVRKVATKYTQCVHRIRLRPIVPKYAVQDIEVESSSFVEDPVLRTLGSEPNSFDSYLPSLLYDNAPVRSQIEAQVHTTPFIRTIRQHIPQPQIQQAPQLVQIHEEPQDDILVPPQPVEAQAHIEPPLQVEELPVDGLHQEEPPDNRAEPEQNDHMRQPLRTTGGILGFPAQEVARQDRRPGLRREINPPERYFNGREH